MIEWLKTNWKTAIIGLAVAIVILSLVCCGGEESPAIIEEPAVEETPVEVITE